MDGARKWGWGVRWSRFMDSRGFFWNQTLVWVEPLLCFCCSALELDSLQPHCQQNFHHHASHASSKLQLKASKFESAHLFVCSTDGSASLGISFCEGELFCTAFISLIRLGRSLGIIV